MFVTRTVLRLRRFRDWSIAQLVFLILGLVRLMPADGAINFVDRWARRIGPHTSRQKLVLYNLKRAFPEKSEGERVKIASDMWASMARLAAEYVLLDKIFDYNEADESKGRVELSGHAIFQDLRDNPRPFIVFTAHTGNFELLPTAATIFGIHVTALFRPPNNPFIAKKLHAVRSNKMGGLVPSQAGAALTLARTLEAGNAVGMLVDQKFKKGAATQFFGHEVHTNPLLAKLVRQFDVEVFPARSIRLPGNRFRLEIEPAIEIPRLENGSVDIARTAQLLNDKVESWVREYPGQWQWFHDRWQIKKQLKKKDQ